MANKKGKFSAFKLFYDEFVYKENNAVSYDNVKRNIDNIREFTIELRKTPKFDVNSYMLKLDRINKRIKSQLDNILVENKKFLEFFLLMYKNHKTLSNDKVSDVPFIISTSFYDDYRIDNKTADELESSNYVVPRFSSLEKKKIRNESKKMSKLEYFVLLLKRSNNKLLYEQFLSKISYMLKLKPILNETNYDYFKRIDSHLVECERLWKRLEDKAKTNEDFENISEIMEIAFKKSFNNWNNSINDIVNEYFDDIYKKMKDDNEIKLRFNLTNDISFETFNETINNLIEEKEKLIRDYEKDKFASYVCESESYLSEFKKVLIDAFFDYRFKSDLQEYDDVLAFVDRTIELYSLADDLDDQIFEKIIFDSSHSSILKRGNDATTALIVKIYELYNPLYLLSIYENSRKRFEELLDKKSLDFKREYNLILLDKKMEYDFHGPLPTMNTIKTKIIERRKDFIYEQCITELFSRELLESYDTRNYDLNVIAKDIPIDDFVNLYYRMKNKIEEFNFSSMNFMNSSLVEDADERNTTLVAAQEFVVKNIYNKLKCKSSNEREKIDKYIDICEKYLKEDILFVDNVVKVNDDTLNKFNENRINFVRNSKWNQFLINNKLKGSL